MDNTLPPTTNTHAQTDGTKPPHKRHIARTVIIVLVAVLMIIGGGVAVALGLLNSRLGKATTGDMLGSDRPTENASISTVRSAGDPFAGRALNILVIGSDSRAGDNNDLTGGDSIDGQRSDTTFILHVSADRTRVEVLSIPRDTLITIPACVYNDNSRVPGSGATRQKFNSAFSYGSSGSKGTLASGVACTIKTVETMSKVRIDGFVVVDFAGFAKIVDTIGGVDIYLPCKVKSPKADNLNLPKGVNHLDGATATSYARARTGVGLGDGSDLMRIQRQQALFMAVAKKVLAMNYLTNLGTLYGFVGSVADSVTTDLGNITGIAGFGFSLRNFDLANLNFATVPVGDAGDGANVVLLPTKDKPYWQALIDDTPLPSAAETPSSTPSDTPYTASPSPSGTPSAGPPPGMVSAPLGQC